MPKSLLIFPTSILLVPFLSTSLFFNPAYKTSLVPPPLSLTLMSSLHGAYKR